MPRGTDHKLFEYANMLSHPLADMRAYGARMLCPFGADAVPALEKALSDYEIAVRLAAVDSLLDISLPRAQMAVFRRLIEDKELRELAADEMSPRIEAAAVLIIERGTPEERKGAAELLFDRKLTTSLDGKNGMESIPILEKALDLNTPETRLAALESLLNMQDIRAEKAVVRALQRDPEFCKEAIGRFSPRVERAAARVMQWGSSDEKCDAAEFLFSIKTITSKSALSRAITTDEIIRAIFIMRMGEKKEERAKTTLINCLKDESPEVRFFAAEALKAFGKGAGPEVEDALGERIENESDPQVLNMVIAALEKMGCPIPPKVDERRMDFMGASTRESRITWLLSRRIKREMDGMDKKETPANLRRARTLPLHATPINPVRARAK
ncbi:MAG: HEAT repeat domain-containing protein [Candidatus Micrarchaeota archaeon]